ncbi:MAG: radical SAM protein [Nanobdellota archaeon]
MALDDKVYRHTAQYRLFSHLNSWLSINPSHGCPLDCAYCVQEKDRWYSGKGVIREYTPEHAVQEITTNPLMTRERPIALYNFSDPFLPQNREDLCAILKALDKQKYQNTVGLITKTLPDKKTLKTLKKLRHMKPVILISYANLPKDVVKASKKDRLALFQKAKKHKIPTIQYFRPTVREWYTNFEKSIQQAAEEVSPYADAVCISGLIYTPEIREKLQKRKVCLPAYEPNGGKHLRWEDKTDIMRIYHDVNPKLPIFSSTSCAVSFINNIPNYNGYFPLRNLEGNGCNAPCVDEQRERCNKGIKQKKRSVKRLFEPLDKAYEVRDQIILVDDSFGMKEHYYIRHNTCHITIKFGDQDKYGLRKRSWFRRNK